MSSSAISHPTSPFSAGLRATAAALAAAVALVFATAGPASASGGIPFAPAGSPAGVGVPAPAAAADETWSGAFGPWTATTYTTDVNNDYSLVSISANPDTFLPYRISVYNDAGERVCRSRDVVPGACGFTSRPATDSSETYTAYVAADAPLQGFPTVDVRAVSEPLTITNTGWNGSLVSFGPTGGGADSQLVEARVSPATAGGYRLSVYTEDGAKVCESTSNHPDRCGFTAEPDAADERYYAFVATSAPPVGFPANPRLSSGALLLGSPSDDFVYVSLGDSFQSGEGAGNAIADTNAYLSTAYENGFNYPSQSGTQENTYVELVAADGNRCHRALQNYAKINRDQLEPGASVVLVDETCSGAQIVPGGQPAIVGSVGGGIDSSSQVSQALARLEAQGLSAADVDLVTVGMGGNDAGFGDIVQACVVPNLLRRVIAVYPNPPAEIEFLANHVASCQNIDLFAKAGKDIDGLQEKEQWAQAQLLEAFPNARVMQLNYPDVLPHGSSVPAWCGGVSATDINLMRDRAARINGEIAGAVAATGSDSLELVDVSGAFGSNPLCPGAGATVMANGFDDRNVDLEIARLLNLNGDGDPVARAQLDALMGKYGVWRACVANKANPFDGDCDLSAAWADVPDSVDEVIAYLDTQKDVILGNLVEAPGPDAEPVPVRYDRSRGLFHPTSAGQEAFACHVRAAYAGVSGSVCAVSFAPPADTVNGAPTASAPIDVSVGDAVSFVLSGFAPFAAAQMTFHSETVELGTATADADGVVRATIEVPAGVPGVHRISVAGEGLGGVQVVKELKVRLPGEPVAGEASGMYLCGFEPEVAGDGVSEFVDVTVLGATVAVIPDDNGCFFLEVPLPDSTTDVTIEAVSRLTGTSVTETVTAVDPDARRFGGWGRGLDGDGAWNSAKAGSTVPIKFRVLEADGSPMRDRSKLDLRTYPVACDDGSEAGAAQEPDAAGWSGLRYQGYGWWSFEWKTSRSFDDSCRSFSVVVDHGGQHDLLVEFEKKTWPPSPGHGNGWPKPGHQAVKDCWNGVRAFLQFILWRW